jgi:Tol biopolymer transport system component
VASLSGDEGTLTIADPVNVTDRDGYDNQPAFLLDGSAVLYTSGRDELQTDVYRYDVASGEIAQVTDTPSSEFSPTPLPAGGFATIHEAAGEQLLWRFDLDGTDRGAILPNVQPVGYQAWGDEDRVAMFVLGEPATLQLGAVATGDVAVVASDIGRSLHKVPGAVAISFVDKSAGDVWYVRQLDLDSGEITELVPTLAGREDMAWTPDGTLLMGDGSELYAWRPGGNWFRVADLSSAGIEGITRLAVSPLGDRVAIVADRAAPTPEQ